MNFIKDCGLIHKLDIVTWLRSRAVQIDFETLKTTLKTNYYGIKDTDKIYLIKNEIIKDLKYFTEYILINIDDYYSLLIGLNDLKRLNTAHRMWIKQEVEKIKKLISDSYELVGKKINIETIKELVIYKNYNIYCNKWEMELHNIIKAFDMISPYYNLKNLIKDQDDNIIKDSNIVVNKLITNLESIKQICDKFLNPEGVNANHSFKPVLLKRNDKNADEGN
jgi:hypothetical protein